MRTLLNKLRGALHRRRHPREYAIFDRYREYTMVPPPTYVRNLQLAGRLAPDRGDVVECGVWKGGMCAGMAELLGPGRRYWLFDSFEGLPPTGDKDGDDARAWQADTESPYYFDNCRAAEEDAQQAMALSGATDVKLVKGWFDKILGNYPADRPIAMLRLDGDWYDSTMQCLEALFPRLRKGGLLLIDDYHTWEGCRRAVDEYLARYPGERVQRFEWDVAYLVRQGGE